jgi:hypothetical protein
MIDDGKFSILIIVMFTWNLKGKIVGIKTACLHGNLIEKNNMEIPKGMQINENDCIISMKKCMASTRL